MANALYIWCLLSIAPSFKLVVPPFRCDALLFNEAFNPRFELGHFSEGFKPLNLALTWTSPPFIAWTLAIVLQNEDSTFRLRLNFLFLLRFNFSL